MPLGDGEIINRSGSILYDIIIHKQAKILYSRDKYECGNKHREVMAHR